MATFVFLHAHPDDEAISTAATMAKVSAEGHRVVLVLATRGEHGEPVEGVLAEGEALGRRREEETRQSAELLGVHRVAFLDYLDSGMMGEPTNDDPDCFWQADVDAAAGRLVALLGDEAVDVLVFYDPEGGYGHPDHIQVHRVGTRAAELLDVEHAYWAVINRDVVHRLMLANPELAAEINDDPSGAAQAPQEPDFGWPEADITHELDLRELVGLKRQAMAAHASQIAADMFFLTLPEDAFTAAFGYEWFVDPTRPRHGEPMRTDLLS